MIDVDCFVIVGGGGGDVMRCDTLWCSWCCCRCFRHLRVVASSGLSVKDAAKRLEMYGRNVLFRVSTKQVAFVVCLPVCKWLCVYVVVCVYLRIYPHIITFIHISSLMCMYTCTHGLYLYIYLPIPHCNRCIHVCVCMHACYHMFVSIIKHTYVATDWLSE